MLKHILTITDSDIKSHFKPTYITRGWHYYQQGRVSDIKERHGKSQTTIRSKVKGSGRKTYSTDIILEKPHDEIEIFGHCSCPIGMDCKHVIATLYGVMAKNLDIQQVSEKVTTVSPQQVADSNIDSSPPVVPRTPSLFSKNVLPSAELSNWMNQFKRIQAKEDSKPKDGKQILYLLQVDTTHAFPRFKLESVTSSRKKDGSFGVSKRYNLDNILMFDATSFVDENDRKIAKLFRLAQYDTLWSKFIPQGTDGNAILHLLLKTGRCYLQKITNSPLTLGEKREGNWLWKFDPKGRQKLFCEVTGDNVVTVMSPLWYVDSDAHQIGLVKVDLAEDLVDCLNKLPAIESKNVSYFTSELAQSLHRDFSIPPPQSLTTKSIRNTKPIPVMQISSHQINVSKFPAHEPEYTEIYLGKLYFEYGGHLLKCRYGEGLTIESIVKDGQLIEIQHNKEFETKCVRLLAKYDLLRLDNYDLLAELPECQGDIFIGDARDLADIIEFQKVTAPILEKAGWLIKFEDNFPLKQLDENVDWFVDIVNGDSNAWFDLDLGIKLDGKTVNMLPIILSTISRLGHRKLELQELAKKETAEIIIRVDENHVMPIQVDRFLALAETIMEISNIDIGNANGGETNKLRLTNHHAASLHSLEDIFEQSNCEWHGGEPLRELGNKLAKFEKIADLSVPTTLHAELRQYQKDGLSWLGFLREYKFGGILADDMGLGKTVQMIAHILYQKQLKQLENGVLIVVPTSLLTNWRMEVQRFAPSLSLITIYGKARETLYQSIKDYDLVLTTYSILLRDSDRLIDNQYSLAVLDEAQAIKNPKSKTAKVACSIRADQRVCLSGTPMENHLGELWSLFEFAMPGFLGSDKYFKSQFRNPIERNNDIARQQTLARKISPFLLRRTKEKVAPELPKKNEFIHYCELEGEQRDLYETVRLAMHEKVRQAISNKGVGQSHIIFLDALLKLRQICCHPQLVKLDAAKQVQQSAKLELFMELISELMESGRHVLVFSQFTSMLTHIEKQLHDANFKYVKLTGQTRDRATPIEKFQQKKVPIFLISLKAGGTGLNLTAADTVIHYDPWWNPAVQEQATARAHRIGQDKPVFVYKLITVGTVEEKIVKLQESKKDLVESMYSQKNENPKALSSKDMEFLFEPLA